MRVVIIKEPMRRTEPREMIAKAQPLFRTCCLAVLAGALMAALGCGPSHGGLPKEDYDKAETALKKALTAWKSGESAKKWSAVKAPIRFVDDAWIKGSRLLDYQIVSITANTDGYPEAIVKLTIEPAKGGDKRTEKALYGINVKEEDQVAIGRDPMY